MKKNQNSLENKIRTSSFKDKAKRAIAIGLTGAALFGANTSQVMAGGQEKNPYQNNNKTKQTQTIDNKVKDNSNKYQEIQIPDRRGTNDFREATKGMKYDQPAKGVENGVYKDGPSGVTGIYTQDGLRYQVQINIGFDKDPNGLNGGPENAAKMAKKMITAYANVLKLYAMDNSVEKLNKICDKYDIDGNGVLTLREVDNVVKDVRDKYDYPNADAYELIEHLKEKVQQKNNYNIIKTDKGYVGKRKIQGTDNYIEIHADTKEEVKKYLDKIKL